MDWEKQIIKIVLLLVSIITFGVAGLMFLEGWSFLDSLYMTVITMSTVGYREVHPLSLSGMVFVITLIVLGVGSFLYIITSLAEYVVAGHLVGALGRRRMKKEIDSLNNHYIICGFGRVGQQVAAELKREGVPCVIIDSDQNSIDRCISEGYLYIQGDASNDEVLKKAGIERVKGLVTATDSDADNVYVTLSAKNLRDDIFVVARANTEGSEHKLHKAGADRVLSPYSIGGRRLASLLLRPTVVEFLDVVMHSTEIELIMEEVLVHKNSQFVSAPMADARTRCMTGANILAIKKKGEKKMIATPSPDIIIEAGDRLVVFGTREQLKELEGLT
ncbi:MAG: potassium channel protein [Deltaproteobacteria bacterium]